MSESKRTHQGRTIRQEIEIEAAAEAVWDAWADPEQIAGWWVDGAEGVCAAGEVLTWIWKDMGYEIPVPVLEAERGKSIVLGGEAPGRGPFLQEIELQQEGGTTRLRLANSGFPDGAEWDDEFEGVDSGWALSLATLKHWLEQGYPNERTNTLRWHAAQFEYEQLIANYDTAAGLRSWLCEQVELEREPLAQGDRVRLTLPCGESLEGHVLARSRRELLLSWPQARAMRLRLNPALRSWRAHSINRFQA